jgi:hypothetical protein
VTELRLSEYYDLACYVWPLRFLRLTATKEQATELIVHARIGLTLFTSSEFHQRHLSKSVGKAKGLMELIDRATGMLPDVLDPTKPAWFTKEELAKKFDDWVSSFTTTLEDEFSTLHAFCVSDKGNFSVDRLVKGASKGLSPSVQSVLSAASSSEIDEAGQCLVLGRSTACGFHALRALELLMIDYVKAANGALPKHRNWGQYIESLKTGGASARLTDHLRAIKDHHRNPLMHPEDVLTIHEATSLLAVSQAAVEIIVAEMRDRKFV